MIPYAIRARKWPNAVWVAFLIAWAAACGGASPPPTAAVDSTAATLPELPEPALALPEGARWILLVEPKQVFGNPGLRRLIDVLMPERRLAAWSSRYAIDPSTVERVAVGSYTGGQLLVARGGLDAEPVLKAAAAEMDATETISDPPRPRVVGLIGTDRYSLAAVGQDGLVLGEGAPESWSVLMRFLDGHSTDMPAPSVTRSVHREPAEAEHSSLVLHILEPLGLPLETPIGLVFAGQQQLSATLTSTDPARLELWIALSGEFPDTIEANLQTLARSIALEPLGTALGIADALPTLRIERQQNIVTVRATLTTDRVIRGLDALFGADLWRLMEPASTTGP